MRVLVVDDNEGARSAIVEVAVAAGFEVVATAEAGGEAVELTRELRPDLVLLDVRLSDLSGYAVEQRIREFSPETRVILLSADPSPGVSNVHRKDSLTVARLRAMARRVDDRLTCP